MSKNAFTYQRLIRLAPSLGDWTILTVKDASYDEIQISPVHNINFDSLPRDVLKDVHTIHYRMAEKMVQKLSKDMSIKIELHSIQASQMSYEDFLISQEEKVVQTDLSLDDMGKVNVIFDWNLADVIVNRLAGGKGERDSKSKFTPIEGSALQVQMEELVPSFTDEWSNIITDDKIACRFSWGPYVQDKTISLRDAYVLFSFNLYFGKESLKKMVIAYPNQLLRQLLKDYQNLDKPPVQNIHLDDDCLSRLKVPVSVALGDAQLSMAELKRLQPGDIVRLDRSLDDAVPIQLGDDVILKGQIGQSDDSQYSLQIIFVDESSKVNPEHKLVTIPSESGLSEVIQDDNSDIEAFEESSDLSSYQDYGEAALESDLSDQKSDMLEDFEDDDFEETEELETPISVEDDVVSEDGGLLGDESDPEDDEFSWDEIEV